MDVDAHHRLHPMTTLFVERDREDETDLFDTTALAAGVCESLATLRQRTLSGDRAQAELARGSLGVARKHAMPPVWQDSGSPSHLHVWVETIYRWGGRREVALEEASEKFRNDEMRKSWLAGHWTPARILLSMGAATLLVSGRFGPALFVLAIRMGISLFLGASWAFPAERRGADPEQRTWACWASHLCDAIVLLAIGAAAVRAGHPGAGMFVICALVAQLLATLARVAAFQHGLQLLRLRLERVMRAGGLLVAVGTAAIVAAGRSEPPWVLLAVLAALPAFIYALIEGARVAAASYLERQMPVSVLVGSKEVFASPKASKSEVGPSTPRTRAV